MMNFDSEHPETHVLDIWKNRLSEAILTNIQNMFSEEIRKKLSLSYISFRCVFFITASSF